MPRRSHALACLLFLALPVTSHATHAIVPDQYTTIQAALDSGNDSVLVRAGTYLEALSASQSGQYLVTIPTPDLFGPVPALPQVTSLTSSNASITVDGFVFSGHVHVFGGVIRGCWIGGGLSFGVGTARAWNNIIFGGFTSVVGAILDVAMNTIIDGSIAANPPGTSYIRRNAVLGPATTGIKLFSDAYANDNFVRGCTDGVELGGEFSGAKGNVIEDCSGIGISGVIHDSQVISANMIRRCGGDGIHVTESSPSTLTVSGNTIDSVRSVGVYAQVSNFTATSNFVRRAGARGFDVSGASSANLRSNQVVRSASDGMVVNATTLSARGNVIGHSGGRGLVSTGQTVSIRLNTSALNAAAGFELAGSVSSAVDSVDRNIGFGNLVGLRWLGPGTGILTCNDWYANAIAATQGISPGSNDLSVNPLFCNPLIDDFSLSSVSPVLNATGCGLIGAMGQGCMFPATAVESPAQQEMRGINAFPRPGAAEIRLSWRAYPTAVEVGIYDAAGARRWRARVEPGRGSLVWRGTDESGNSLPAGMYFARIEGAEELAATRVVLVR